jgi:hypothetical protein
MIRLLWRQYWFFYFHKHCSFFNLKFKSIHLFYHPNLMNDTNDSTDQNITFVQNIRVIMTKKQSFHCFRIMLTNVAIAKNIRSHSDVSYLGWSILTIILLTSHNVQKYCNNQKLNAQSNHFEMIDLKLF